MGGKRPRRKFSDEFKRDAVEIVRTSGKPIRQVANELGIYDSTLGNWVRQAEINRGEREGLTSDERERLRELERENARLRMERELLKRAVWSSPRWPDISTVSASCLRQWDCALGRSPVGRETTEEKVL